MSTARLDGVKKQVLPDYFNEITRKKVANLEPFE